MTAERQATERDPARPRATYRLQLRPGFGFDDAASIVPYLARLGISHLYLSPVLEAVPGSAHGYDVVDPTRVRGELGGEEGWTRLVEAVRRHGLGIVLDVVPNHMAVSPGAENPWWWDVLENGPASFWANHFDIDPEGAHPLLLPVLGDHAGRVVEAGEIAVEREGAAFRFRYHERAFPVAPRSLGALLREASRSAGGGEGALSKLADELEALPPPTAGDRESVRRRHREKEALRAALASLLASRAEAARAVDGTLARWNADPDRLDALLGRQNHRLAYWRLATTGLGYRRFFDVTTLVALRVEDDNVFEDVHRRVLDWVREGIVDGLRIDHPDGLRDPLGYLRRLQEEAPAAWIVVEKILEPGEGMRLAWPIDGTTGYEFLTRSTALFVDAAGEAGITALWESFTRSGESWADTVEARKRQVLEEILASEVNRLTTLLAEVCAARRRHRDHPERDLRRVIRETLASFPVYRTYVVPGRDAAEADDEQAVASAIGAVRERQPELDAELLDLVENVLLGRERGATEDELALRFQQATGSAMAKGVEDTAYYVYGRFVCLNEVGGDPGAFGTSVDAFFAETAEAARRHPASMVATSTHDTKRSEDVRARLALLSEIPDEWGAAVRRWSGLAERHRTDDAPDRAAELLYYQTLVGTWPIDVARAAAYMEKAAREAKSRTSWHRPDAVYEDALARFVRGTLADDRFVAEVEAFVAPLVDPGRRNALGLKLLALTAPGVPDVYQGTELWDSSLVDPDNRRPVDFALRERLLDEASLLSAEEILERADEGLPKLHLVARALDLRRRRPEAFAPGAAFARLPTTGRAAGHVVAFVRAGQVVAIVPRLPLRLAGRWDETAVDLPDGRWTNVLTGEEIGGGRVEIARLVARFPVALLARNAP